MRRKPNNRQGNVRTSVIVAVICILLLLAIIATPILSEIGQKSVAKKNRCAGRMRDIGTAMLQYEVDNRAYPGYRNVLLMTNDASYVDPDNGEGGVTWFVPVLSG
ncbi:MAG: hypothetical protein JSS27_10980 [Planctomycetes bacterium]|nr:hypothetical protein [Planctomycetota bacterium]